MIDTKELRMIVQDFKLDGSPVFIQTKQMEELLDRLEAAEKERDELRSKIDQMERQKPIGTVGGMPGTTGFTMACFHADEVPIGSKLYALPGTKGEEK